MNRWTESAEAELDEYSARVRRQLKSSGVDAEEVAEDLRRHVHEEVEAEKLPLVTAQDVSRILARIGTPKIEPQGPVEPEKPKVSPGTNGSGLPARAPGYLALFFGVLLPLGTIVFEFLTGACAAVLFDPFPTAAHIVLTLLVPLANLGVWLALRRGDAAKWRSRLGWANGLAIGVSGFYAVLFLPFSPFALLGVLVYGLGLVPLSPVISFLCAIYLRTRMHGAPSSNGATLPGLWRGAALALGALLLFTLPLIITKVGMSMAASPSRDESARGVGLLRSWGEHEELLRACYGRQNGSGLNEIYTCGNPVTAENAREIYYRAYGRAFNSVPPPKLYAGRARWSVLEEEFTWDDDQAGDAVAGRVKGLSLTSSRQDGFIDPDAAVTYVEWTLEFQNVSVRQREARAQVQLPPGGVVSRLTLWINGEEREAAFGGRSQVKTAYQSVVSQSRDPVLVTTRGPDRVLVQCFPVPASGGKMKVRLGITAPLTLAASDTGLWRAPCFLERNFTLPQDFKHSVWLESKGVLTAGGGKLRPLQTNGRNGLRGEVTDPDLQGNPAVLTVKRSAEAMQRTFPDARAGGALVRQAVVQIPAPKADRIVFVLDGTEGLDDAASALADALLNFPTQTEVGVLMASDGWREILAPTRADGGGLKKAAATIRKLHGKGGHDNVPALLQAWDLAAEVPNGVIVWIHGAQPVLMESVDPLRQRFERHSAPPFLVSLPVKPAPNCILEKLDGIRAVQSEMRRGRIAEDLDRVLQRCRGQVAPFQLVREQVSGAAETGVAGADTVASHVARLWAFDEVERLAGARKKEDAMALAAKYQLVTAVSGAVVLESVVQYAQAGLEPVDPETVPAVPEPTAGALLVVGALMWAMRRKMRGARRALVG